MVDREKILAVLLKRFPRAPLCDVAAAANAIVGLEPEFDPLAPADVQEFTCATANGRYTARHVATRDVVVFRKVARTRRPGG